MSVSIYDRISTVSIRKNIFACLFSVHNTINLSRHEQVCLIRLRFERYFSHHRVSREEYLSKRSLIKHTCSWRDKLIVSTISPKKIPRRNVIQSTGRKKRGKNQLEAASRCSKFKLQERTDCLWFQQRQIQVYYKNISLS